MQNKRAFDDFLMKDVPRNAKKRFDDERKQKQTDHNSYVRLDDLLCKKEAFINDKKYKYILITNDICYDKTCCEMKDHSELDWAKSIEFEAVFDFNPKTFKNGLGDLIMNSKDVLVKPYDVTGISFKLFSNNVDLLL